MTSNLTSFNDFVSQQLNFSKSLLIQTELSLLQHIPTDIIFLVTFSDFELTVFKDFNEETERSEQILLNMMEMCLGFYLFSFKFFSFESLCIAAYLKALENVDKSQSLGISDIKDQMHFFNDFDCQSVKEIQKDLLDENSYTRMLFF